jgi:leucyl aminopeptidase (aminopeptidase T)
MMQGTGGSADFATAVANVIRRCLGVSEGEEVLVIGDPGTTLVADALRREATSAGADTVLALIEERATHGTEPPTSVAAALSACDVYLAATTRSLSHTTARKDATNLGVRGATMPGVTADMLARVMAVDFVPMADRSRQVAQLLTHAATAQLSCARGSEMTFDLTGRAGIADDGDLTSTGAFGNLPCGEAFISPRSGEGHVVAMSLASLGFSDPAASLSVDAGRLISAEGGLGPRFLELLHEHGEPGLNLAELGVGTNDRAMLTGNVLEDEKILGSVHVAFGASAAIGGSVTIPIHLDAIISDASLLIDGEPVLEKGRWVLERHGV